MSPRKNNVLTVEAWPDPKSGKLYKGRIRASDVKGKSKYLHVTIENLDPSQIGRIHDVSLPLPLRPGNRTCSFLTACGIDVSTVGTRVCLDDITGATIGIRFGAVALDGSQQVDFEKTENTSKIHTNISGSESINDQLIDNTPQCEIQAEREF
jgi:hypothetical protein